jgi:hypothetical protein
MSLRFMAIAVAVAIAGIAVGIAIRRIVGAWLTFRSHFVVTCPQDQTSRAVVVDCEHAVWTTWRGDAELRLTGCSDWPERAGCDQRCREQIQRAPEDCLARTILAKWYADKCCMDCGQPVGEAYWNAKKPALLTREHGLQVWEEIPLDQLQTTLEGARAVCFECYVSAKIGPVSAASLL